MSADDVTVRRVRSDDVATVVGLVHDLAAFEREPGACTLTPDDLARALFADDPAVFGHVVEAGGADGGEIAGIALWFLTFSTWTGTHGIHLEDLYVVPHQRRRGVARRLLATLAAECVARGYRRLEWAVLDWNAGALGLYAEVGATPMRGWTTQRVDGEALTRLAD